MRPTDTLAIAAGTTTGAVLSESVEQIIASIGATVAVYLVNALLRWIVSRWKLSGEPENNP